MTSAGDRWTGRTPASEPGRDQYGNQYAGQEQYDREREQYGDQYGRDARDEQPGRDQSGRDQYGGQHGSQSQAGGGPLGGMMGGGQWGWPAMLLAGLATLVLGAIITAHPTGSAAIIAVLLGVVLVICGVYNLVAAFGHNETGRFWHGIAGLLFIITGIVLIRHLWLTLAVLGLIIGWTLIAWGISLLLLSFSSRSMWAGLLGAISLIAGIVISVTPVHSLTRLAVLAGILFMILGIAMMASSFGMRREREQGGGGGFGAGATGRVPGQRVQEPEPDVRAQERASQSRRG